MYDYTEYTYTNNIQVTTDKFTFRYEGETYTIHGLFVGKGTIFNGANIFLIHHLIRFSDTFDLAYVMYLCEVEYTMIFPKYMHTKDERFFWSTISKEHSVLCDIIIENPIEEITKVDYINCYEKFIYDLQLNWCDKYVHKVIQENMSLDEDDSIVIKSGEGIVLKASWYDPCHMEYMEYMEYNDDDTDDIDDNDDNYRGAYVSRGSNDGYTYDDPDVIDYLYVNRDGEAGVEFRQYDDTTNTSVYHYWIYGRVPYNELIAFIDYVLRVNNSPYILFNGLKTVLVMIENYLPNTERIKNEYLLVQRKRSPLVVGRMGIPCKIEQFDNYHEDDKIPLYAVREHTAFVAFEKNGTAHVHLDRPVVIHNLCGGDMYVSLKLNTKGACVRFRLNKVVSNNLIVGIMAFANVRVFDHIQVCTHHTDYGDTGQNRIHTLLNELQLAVISKRRNWTQILHQIMSNPTYAKCRQRLNIEFNQLINQ
jgi:hypothetical protein